VNFIYGGENMFETTLIAAPASTRKRLLAVGSVALHLVIGGVFLVLSLWEIHELGRPTRGVAMAHGLGLPPPSGGAQAKAEAKRIKPKPKHKIVKDTRQPDQRPSVKEDAASATATSGDGTGTGDGNGPPGPGGPGMGTSLGIGLELCVDSDQCAPPPVPKEDVETPPQMVPSSVLSSLTRTAGESQIQPPTSTRNAMSREGTQQVTATILMCLDKQGGVASQKLVRSSGFPDYDAKLRSGVRRWRYRPFLANGKAAAICTQVIFVYKQM